ncbi:UvrD-helicase domain-containing protein [Aureitalea marina]|uniref:UvrD-like helicase ATP-binding domain-containing protein n=1 Tax=Aureitalea marina TaxID=930804 RepID=A0A2S7KS27_9FLAO|nr:UvrD-helicase domain-containing protein [Aureitalea marina]PQB05363.1 hypothetical protein BST85_11045 [Aureitalea marina]
MDSSGPSPNIFIYDASAGSGKTFTLVREYLTELLISKNPSFFRHILAITFTNKATAEMKNRIISTLIDLSWIEPKDPPAMLEELIESTGLDRSKIKSRARSILEHLLRNYGMFSVETIDSFNHRLLRTFASDLKLPGQFEVSLDTEDLLLMAVDRLIDKVGEERVLTDLLIEFALEKTESDKSWDVGYDLFNSSKILAKDKEQESLESLLSNSLTELLEYRQALLDRVAGLRRLIQANGEGIMEMFRQKDIERLNFTRGYIFDFYQKLAEGNTDMNLQTKWLQNLESQDPYTSKQKQEIKDLVDGLMPDVISTYHATRPLIIELRFLENILSNFIPIAVLKLIDNEIQGLEKELQILPIYKFNRIIGSKIKDQPSPFIYERLGERYRKFMIDEFQDTSFLQWQNLIPLIENALSQQYTDGTFGQLTLVGDAKQSIYRWRGGLPEQFIELDQTNIPFQGAMVQMSHLPRNYRSRDQIIDFNNGFFTHTSGFLSYMAYQELYRTGNRQETNKRPGDVFASDS